MFVVEEAQKIGLHGTVRNLHDGRVEVIAEGDRERLDALVARLRDGPPSASVSGLELDWDEKPEGLAGFDITYV
jgi:acylphosphatase